MINIFFVLKVKIEMIMSCKYTT